ncbi:hypothetical protein [Nocardiopsis sp. JB363]|uniref:hypothetical protein n=1 Tax=Nocardiopsis sp. JB363 TaxID=1434837 RepID=UPI000B35C80D|nr:hypothetical protein [Nocardiopsis sp. JB363]
MEVHTQVPARPLFPSFLGGGAVLAVSLGLVAFAWNAHAPDPIEHRIFLVLWLSGSAILACHLWTDARSSRGASRSLSTFAIGLVAAAALTTMPWANLDSALWYQVWLSVPLLTGLALVAFRPTPRDPGEESSPH